MSEINTWEQRKRRREMQRRIREGGQYLDKSADTGGPLTMRLFRIAQAQNHSLRLKRKKDGKISH